MLTKAWKKNLIMYMIWWLIPYVFAKWRKPLVWHWVKNDLSKGKIWRLSIRKRTTNMSNYFTSELSLQYSCAIVDSVLLMLSFHVLHMLDLEYCAAWFHSFQLRWWDSRTVHLPWCFDLSSATTWSSHCGCTHLCLNTIITFMRLKNHQVSMPPPEFCSWLIFGQLKNH